MSLNKLELTEGLRETLAEINCWAIDETDIKRAAVRMMGRLSTPLLRRAKARTIIAGRKFGSDAGRFADEFQQLAEQCAIIRAGAHDPEIQATAFFHLRFENIHPLTDCNGRLGRLILAEQIRRSYDVPLEEIGRAHV